MSLEQKSDRKDEKIGKNGNVMVPKGDNLKTQITRMAFANQLQNAEYKDGVGFELDAREEFLLKNKAFFKKMARDKK